MADTPKESKKSAKEKVAVPLLNTSPGKGHIKVESWFDLVKAENDVLAFWEQSDAFNTLVAQNRDGETFSFLDGPITANNPMGVHHAWGRTLKDSYQRYHAMQGKALRYQNGFDCQGLWVEIEVEKEKKLKSKQDVLDFGIGNFTQACKDRVTKYAGVQTEQSKRLGMWMDWDNSYFTMSERNNYTIWSFLKKCHERGKVYRGSDVMPWSGRSGSAYSQMEVIEGRKLVAHTAIFARFPLRDRKDENLLIWTTTPWTLTANVSAAVNPDLEYVKIKETRNGRIYYLAKENLNYKRLDKQFKEKKEWIAGVPKLKTLAQIFNERGGFEEIGVVKGSELVGLTYDGPFDELPAQNISGGHPFTDERISASPKEAHIVIDGGRDSHGNPIVVAGEGTGIVHSAPGCGDVDHKMGVANKLPMLAPLDESASFLPEYGSFAGKLATDKTTVAEVIALLKERDLLVATEQYPHVYPHCWRTGDELVFRLVDEWFIDMDWRDEIKAVVDDIKWIPAWGQDREHEWLSNMRDWMISKKRFWGLALPIWRCGDCNTFDVIGSKEELQERAVSGWTEFEGNTPHRPWIDEVTIACPSCKNEIHRVEDVGNPWLDAGIVPYSTMRYSRDQSSDDRSYWEKWFPADLVLECFPGQFRNWFYSLLSMSTMMENRAPFKTLIGHALVRDEKGEEMHKSTGNAIWFDDAADEYGADVMRWLYAKQEPTSNLNFGPKGLREVRGTFLNTLWNTYSFYCNYARLADFVPKVDDTSPPSTVNDFDRWILSELQECIETVHQSFERFDMRAAARAMEGFVGDLSGWYVRHNRRRFWKSEDDGDLKAALWTLGRCLRDITAMLAPIIPFTTEVIYQNLVRGVNPDAKISVHHQRSPQVDASLKDDDLTAQMRAIKRITSMALAAREGAKIKVRQPVGVLRICPKDKIELAAIARFEEMLCEDLNVKRVECLSIGEACPLRYDIKANFKRLGQRFGKDTQKVASSIADVVQEDDSRILLLFSTMDKLPLETALGPVDITSDDLIRVPIQPEGASVIEDYGTWVSIATEISSDLKREGLMREFLRRVQVARKDLGFEIEDRIHLKYGSADKEVVEMIDVWRDYLAQELLCLSINSVDASTPTDASAVDLDIDGNVLSIYLAKA